MRNDHYQFPVKDTIMHVALIGVFGLMLAVTVLLPDVMTMGM